jgi:hypothetical protein
MAAAPSEKVSNQKSITRIMHYFYIPHATREKLINQSINQPKIERRRRRSKKAPTPPNALAYHHTKLNVKQGDFGPPPNTTEEGSNAVAWTFRFKVENIPKAL